LAAAQLRRKRENFTFIEFLPFWCGLLVETLSFRHIGVVNEEYAVSGGGMKMFGVLHLETHAATNSRVFPGSATPDLVT